MKYKIITNSKDEKKISRIVLQILKCLHKKSKKKNQNLTFLCLNVVSKNKIKRLNKKYLYKDYATDVLSFQNPNLNMKSKIQNLGDLVLCLDVAKKQAKQYKHSLTDEFFVLCVHGILHLLGYDHEKSTKDLKRMLKREQEILASCRPKVKAGLLSRVNAKQAKL